MTDTANLCLIVSGTVQSSQYGGGRPSIRCQCVNRLFPMRSLASTTSYLLFALHEDGQSDTLSLSFDLYYSVYILPCLLPVILNLTINENKQVFMRNCFLMSICSLVSGSLLSFFISFLISAN